MRAARSFTTVPEMTNPASGIEGTSSAPIVGRVGWTFLTNHAHVLLAIARDHEVTMRETAAPAWSHHCDYRPRTSGCRSRSGLDDRLTRLFAF